MIDLKKIVAATDLSDNSLHAVQYSCGLAAQFGAEIHLLHVVCYPFADFAEQCRKDYGRKFDEYQREYEQAARDSLESICIDPLTEADRVVRTAQSGFPVADIPRYADEMNADLLILGTHGRTGLKHVLMGSVCESVVRQARCPVLTVRAP